MAANDYYNNPYAPHSRPDSALYNNSYGGSRRADPSDNHLQPRSNSYGSHSYGPPDPSDTDLSGRATPQGDYISDNIPLQPKNARHEWMDGDTHYSPNGQDAQMADPLSNRSTKGKKSGWFSGRKIAWVTYIVSLVQLIVFIVELVRNGQLTGSPFFNVSANPMLGPSPYVQINMGARYVACMRNNDKIQNSPLEIKFPCPNSTYSDINQSIAKCTLSDVCGFSGVPNPKAHGSLKDKPQPNQWFRFIVPIFLHAGVIHIAFNLFSQLSLGADMERTIGWWRYTIVYFTSGIFGFILGGNLAAPAISSTGASGSLFGIFALCFLDLLYHWKQKHRPVCELFVMIITIAISFVLGLLPGLDNFSHIGGFITGLALGICLLRSPDSLRERIGGITPYSPMGGRMDGSPEIVNKFTKAPVGFFKGRKPLWWGWWLLRACALVGFIAALVVLINNFYKSQHTCSWCKYLSCLPIKNWCNVGQFEVKNITENSTNSRRFVFLP